jgi:hypothetical protein
VLNLAAYGRIRVMADRLGVESIDRQANAVVLKFRDGARAAGRTPDPARVIALLRRRPDVTLAPPSSLRLDLAGPHARPEGLASRGSVPAPASTNRREGSPSGLPRARSAPGSRKPRSSSPSWWTARATTGAVTPGFSKAEILKPPKENPLAEGGLFDRVSGLLEELGPGTISH